MKKLSLFVDNGSYLTKVHPFTKIVYIAAAISIPLIGGKLWLFACLIAASICILASGRVLFRTFPLIAFSFSLIALIFLVNGLFNSDNETILFAIGSVKFYKEGLLYASKIGLNVLNMLLSFAVFVLSTKPQDLVDELEKHGLSPKAGYIINSIFQIIPQMMGMMETITDAQRSRGMETEGGLFTRAKAFLPLISPVVMSSLVNTRDRAIALEIRGFGSKGKKTWLYDRPKHKGDTAVTIFLFMLIAAAIIWRVVSCLL